MWTRLWTRSAKANDSNGSSQGANGGNPEWRTRKPGHADFSPGWSHSAAEGMSGRKSCFRTMSKRRILSNWVAISIRAAKNWNEDGAFAHSAAVSFYTLFSLAPITIIVLSIAGFFFGPEVATRQFNAQISSLVSKSSAEMIQQAVAEAKPQRRGWTSTVVNSGMLIIGATTVFAQLQDALNKIWGVKSKPGRAGWLVLIMQRLISFAMVVT